MSMKGKRMLWVEDDYFRLRGMVRPLQKRGLEVVSVENEREATELLDKKQHFDVFLIDILIPEGLEESQVESAVLKDHPGLSLIEKIRCVYKLSTPILVLTVVQDARVLGRIRKIGVSNILLKGYFHPSELEHEVALSLGIESDTPELAP